LRIATGEPCVVTSTAIWPRLATATSVTTNAEGGGRAALRCRAWDGTLGRWIAMTI